MTVEPVPKPARIGVVASACALILALIPSGGCDEPLAHKATRAARSAPPPGGWRAAVRVCLYNPLFRGGYGPRRRRCGWPSAVRYSLLQLAYHPGEAGGARVFRTKSASDFPKIDQDLLYRPGFDIEHDGPRGEQSGTSQGNPANRYLKMKIMPPYPLRAGELHPSSVPQPIAIKQPPFLKEWQLIQPIRRTGRGDRPIPGYPMVVAISTRRPLGSSSSRRAFTHARWVPWCIVEVMSDDWMRALAESLARNASDAPHRAGRR
jgi:hypothetical protein